MKLFDEYDDEEFADVDLEDIEFDIFDDGLEEMTIEQEIADSDNKAAIAALYGKYES